MMSLLTIDGDHGEGGGQILRTALSLSLCRQQPFRIINIRARRTHPGLRRQHLMAVQAATAIGKADVEGAELGSQELTFAPTTRQPGEYRFDIGSAGSTTLVLQTLLPALVSAAGPSRLELIGGTHNPMAPPIEFIQYAFVPLLRRMGARVKVRMERAGFYPLGGGILHVEIEPVACLHPLHLSERGRLLGIQAVSLLGNLPGHIAERELGVLQEALSLTGNNLQVEYVDCEGQGNALYVRVHSEQVTEIISSIGQRGLRAEKVAQRLLAELRRYLAVPVAVGPYLADQLLLPLALAGGGSFTTLAPDAHTPTNIAVVRKFLDIPIRSSQQGHDQWLIELGDMRR